MELCVTWPVPLRATERLTRILVELNAAESVAVIVAVAVIHSRPLWLEEAVLLPLRLSRIEIESIVDTLANPLLVPLELPLWLSSFEIDSTLDTLAHPLFVPVSLPPPPPPVPELGDWTAVAEVQNEREALAVCEISVLALFSNEIVNSCVADEEDVVLGVIDGDERDVDEPLSAEEELTILVEVAVVESIEEELIVDDTVSLILVLEVPQNVFIAVWLRKDEQVPQLVIVSVDITLTLLHPELLIVSVRSGVRDTLSRDWDGSDDNVVVWVEVIEGNEEIVELEVKVWTLEKLPLKTVPVILLLGLFVLEFVLIIGVRVCAMLIEADTLSVEYKDEEAKIALGEEKPVCDTEIEVA